MTLICVTCKPHSLLVLICLEREHLCLSYWKSGVTALLLAKCCVTDRELGMWLWLRMQGLEAIRNIDVWRQNVL